METYDNPAEYKGKEWNELLKALSPKDMRKTLKSAYRKVGNELLMIAREKVASSDMQNAGKVAKSMRLRVYTRGGGFMITTKPHGKQGYYVNRKGLEKPVLMWAEEGTKYRFPRKGFFYAPLMGGVRKVEHMGKMPAYHFLDEVRARGGAIIEGKLGSELESAVERTADKLGWGK